MLLNFFQYHYNNYLKDIPVEKIGDYERELFRYIADNHSDITDSIRNEKVLTPENEEKLKNAPSH